MSTRGSVAWRENGKVVGVYNHFDSYPTSLAVDVWDAAHDDGGLLALVAKLQAVGDWRELESMGVCKYCGKKTGQPHSICAELVMRTPDPAIEYLDPDCNQHKHGAGKADQFDPFIDPLFMEWVYLLDPERNVIEVWSHIIATPLAVKVLEKAGKQLTNPVSSKQSDNPWTYAHVLVATVDVLDKEPDWHTIERGGDELQNLVAAYGTA